MSQNSEFKLSLELRIDWGDLDMYEHVNNVSYMRYLQSGRVNLWEASGIYDFYQDTNQGTMLVSTKCDFKNPLFYPGKAIVKTAVDHIGTKSFGIKHHVLNEEGVLCAEGRDVVVCFDFDKNQTFEIPPWLREKLNQF